VLFLLLATLACRQSIPFEELLALHSFLTLVISQLLLPLLGERGGLALRRFGRPGYSTEVKSLELFRRPSLLGGVGVSSHELPLSVPMKSTGGEAPLSSKGGVGWPLRTWVFFKSRSKLAEVNVGPVFAFQLDKDGDMDGRPQGSSSWKAMPRKSPENPGSNAGAVVTASAVVNAEVANVACSANIL
jgi:hypothetical protein